MKIHITVDIDTTDPDDRDLLERFTLLGRALEAPPLRRASVDPVQPGAAPDAPPPVGAFDLGAGRDQLLRVLQECRQAVSRMGWAPGSGSAEVAKVVEQHVTEHFMSGSAFLLELDPYVQASGSLRLALRNVWADGQARSAAEAEADERAADSMAATILGNLAAYGIEVPALWARRPPVAPELIVNGKPI